jgi:hypothetical protein
LVEARGHFPGLKGKNEKGETFHEWVRGNVVHPMTGEPLGKATVKRWMQATRQIEGPPARSRAGSLASMSDRRWPSHPKYNPKLDWQSQVRKEQQKLDLGALAEKWETARQEEMELQELAERIIQTGYRALAAIVHPDKATGDKVAFQKLTKAKNWLREAIRK